MKKLVVYFIVFLVLTCFWLALPVERADAATASIVKAKFDSLAPKYPKMIFIQFSDHVYGAGGGALTLDNFIYTDNNGSGMTGIEVISHNPGDNWAILRGNANSVGTDSADTIEVAEGKVFTAAGALPGRTPVNLVDNLGTPPVLRTYPGAPAGAISQIGSMYILAEFQTFGDAPGSFIPMTGSGGGRELTFSDSITATGDIWYYNNSMTPAIPSSSYHVALDYYAVLEMNMPFVGPEFVSDVVDCGFLGTATDLWGNACLPSLVYAPPPGLTLQMDSTACYINKVEGAWRNAKGEITFFDPMRGVEEPVYGSVAPGGVFSSLLPVNFQYNDNNGSGVSGFSSLSHSIHDSWVDTQWNTTVIAGDLATDQVTSSGTPGTDLFGNTIGTTKLLNDTIDPVIISAQTLGDSSLSITWSEHLFSGTVNSVTADNGTISFSAIDTTGNPTIIWSGGSATWNTDATGNNAGIGTDYNGVNQSSLPDITILAADIKDRSGNGNPAYVNYDTAKDGAAPEIVNFSPANGATNVAATLNPTVTFSEPVQNVIYSMVPDPGGLTSSWDPNNMILTVLHNTFGYNASYTLTVTSADDLNANSCTFSGPLGNSTAFTTSMGSSGQSGAYPRDFSMIINDDDEQTTSPEVILTISAYNADYMLIGNDPNFSDSEGWEAYATSKEWTLTEDYETKAVYIRFKSADENQSQTIYDTIEYVERLGDEVPEFVEPPIDQEPFEEGDEEDEGEEEMPYVVTFPNNLQPGNIIKGSSTTVYYLAEDYKKHAFPNETVFYSWFFGTDSLVIVTDSVLNNIPTGKNVTMRPGTWLIKAPSSEKVYAVEPGGVLRWLESNEVAQKLFGLKWSEHVQDVAEVFISDYVIGDSLTDYQYPSGSLIQYPDSTDLYYVDGNYQRWIESKVAFEANYFMTKFVVKITDDGDLMDLDDGSPIIGGEKELYRAY